MEGGGLLNQESGAFLNRLKTMLIWVEQDEFDPTRAFFSTSHSCYQMYTLVPTHFLRFSHHRLLTLDHVASSRASIRPEKLSSETRKWSFQTKNDLWDIAYLGCRTDHTQNHWGDRAPDLMVPSRLTNLLGLIRRVQIIADSAADFSLASFYPITNLSDNSWESLAGRCGFVRIPRISRCILWRKQKHNGCAVNCGDCGNYSSQIILIYLLWVT